MGAFARDEALVFNPSKIGTDPRVVEMVVHEAPVSPSCNCFRPWGPKFPRKLAGFRVKRVAVDGGKVEVTTYQHAMFSVEIKDNGTAVADINALLEKYSRPDGTAAPAQQQMDDMPLETN